jgi:hypothetical protein
MSTDSPQSHSAPESNENFSKPGEVERNWDIPTAANLSDIQLRAIELIIQGYNDTQAAQILSINRRTLWHWRNFDENYRDALTEARHQFHATVTDRYESLIFRATAILVKFLEDPTDTTRMKAAQILLNIASRYKPAPAPRRATNNLPEDDDWPAPVFEPKVG